MTTMIPPDHDPNVETPPASGPHAPNAGKCSKCGLDTSWEYTITNPVTGRRIPGHLDADGFPNGGDGDCPYYKARRTKGLDGTPATHRASAMVVSSALPAATTSGTTYPNDAGTCSRCGLGLTWKKRVLNPASGKMMPGHVNADGTVAGDGRCPSFSKKDKQAVPGAPSPPPPSPSHSFHASGKPASPPGTDMITITIPRDVAFRLLRSIASGGGWDEA